MKAIVYGGKGQFTFQDVPEPPLEPGGLLARVECCGICGTDYKLFHNDNPRFPSGSILGHEFCATVTDVSDEAQGFVPGDRIAMSTTVPCGECFLCRRGQGNLCPNALCVSAAYPGAFAERIPIPAQALRMGNVVKVPEGLANEAAALAEPLSCVINAQEAATVGEGMTVVVVGAGPLGCMHIEAAHARGAAAVIAVQRSRPRCELARRFDVADVICSLDEDVPARVRELTDGRGADRVIVCAPDRTAQEQSVDLACKGGVVSLFASLPKGESDLTLDSRTIHYGQLAVVGCSDSTGAQAREGVRLLAEGKVRSDLLVTHHVTLDHILDGIAIMDRREGLKVMVDVAAM
ncbi:alcohol dehydrogenase catalytic domain-containing protein [bacterium]|nr:alcohol dehydrogenase catalytic domain-containing protein [bacterium]